MEIKRRPAANFKHKILFISAFIGCNILLCFMMFDLQLYARSPDIIIVLDPGHGGDDSGAEREYDDTVISEKQINLKLAILLKQELEKYQHIKVYLTRDDDSKVDLESRTLTAKTYYADALISLHINAKGGNFIYDDGCTVLVSQGQYKRDLAEEEKKLGVNILNELAGLGIEDQGLLLRDSENGETYENGATADYYAIIRNGIKQDILSVLIEHAFLDNEDDYYGFLNSEDKLKKLAQADARGIARYYGLMEKDTGDILEPLTSYEEKIVHVFDQDPDHTIITKEVFYEERLWDRWGTKICIVQNVEN